ncbi:hypothetical protein [Sphaerisporangium sp. TRM90804]|uniref:DUF6907 domain-containing protein n=1 Tax=Sphaerisporangium sp. TRM90804 TaxID=3031113 RepID=UPI00244B1D8A|nr:hypothetical protein [Sphaerisporangium sp. TRM90804]MDH2429291.1 hypothetical protein [Sphaerisporangium sp. TRM90804]
MTQRTGVNADAAIDEAFSFNSADQPYWQTSPCPRWCVTPHYDSDPLDDRSHAGLNTGVALTLADPAKFGPHGTEPFYRYRAPTLTGSLLQHLREIEPVVELLDERDEYNAKLTLDEAVTFAGSLLVLVAEGRNPTVGLPAPGGAAGHQKRSGHQEWCRDPHGAHDDGVCHAPELSIDAGRIGLTYNPQEGARVHFERESHNGMTPVEAEQLAFQLLAYARWAD